MPPLYIDLCKYVVVGPEVLLFMRVQCGVIPTMQTELHALASVSKDRLCPIVTTFLNM